jgi:two-component system, OmpR family, KDP operon response regulator KdpE
MTRVLVVDDEPQLLRVLRVHLEARGYQVDAAPDGRSALELAAQSLPDVVVLDLGLPDISGVEVIAGLRGWTQVPIIILSVHEEEADKITALDAGADDYVTKPFSMAELLARVRAASRRTPPAKQPPVIRTDDFTIDLAARRVTTPRNGAVRLTPTEWHLVELLVTNPGRLVSQRQLLREVWGPQAESVTAAIGGRAAGLISSLSAALSYNFFFTTPYYTLRIDSASQILTVILLFAGGLLASLGGRASRRAGVEVREEADAIRLLQAVNLAAASGKGADQLAAQGLLNLLEARSVRVVRAGAVGDRIVAEAGERAGIAEVAALPHLDQDGRIPSGHLRSVGGTLVLPAEGTAVDLVRGGQRVGTLVILPAPDHPLLRTTRTAIAAIAHALALAEPR